MSNKRRASPSGPVTSEKLSVGIAGGTVVTASVSKITATCTGLGVYDVIAVNPTAPPATGLGIGAPWVSAANEITVPIVNPTAASIAAGTITLSVARLAFSS